MKEKYTFIGNQPLGKDLFKNQSQEKIAAVITEHIISNEKFKIIGVDGAWGSGKSNLVQIIEKKLGDKYKFFIYDVWGHQEDEQRKAILVELTEFIKSDKNNLVSNKKIWEDKLTGLLANRKQTKTINQPYLSIGFIFALLSIIYVPLVNVFKDVSFFGIRDNIWRFVLVTAPVLLVVAIYFWNVICNLRKKERISKSFKLAAEETFQVYTNKQKEETKIETISENQPSVRDFQNWMSDIDHDLKKSVVIVFDNFDRLPKKHILSIWSSIHIFFAEKKYEKIKIIIPFDREHLQNAFKELNRDTVDKVYSDDYINKTFDIVFRVSPPLMSDWKKFLRDNWETAFAANDNQGELDKAIQAYEYLNKRTTPREIIAFINEIIAVKYIDDNFKERYIAIFILCREHILDNPLKGITDLSYLNGLESLYKNDLVFAQQITGIVYHVSPEGALELIYTEELRKALYQRNVARFNEICRADFVDDIFFSVINNFTEFSNLILTLNQLDDNTKVSKARVSEAWSLIYEKLLSDERKSTTMTVDDWQITLVARCEDNQYLQNLIDNIYELWIEENVDVFVSTIDKLLLMLDKERVLSVLIPQDIQPNRLIDLIKLKSDSFADYKLRCDSARLDDYFAALPIDELLASTYTDILVRNYHLPKYEFLLRRDIGVFADGNQVARVGDAIMKLKEFVVDNGDIKEILSDSHIYNLHVNYRESYVLVAVELLAMRLGRGADFFSSYVSYFDTFLSSDSLDSARIISNTILNYQSYGTLLSYADMFQNSSLYRNVIAILMDSYDLDKDWDEVKMIEKYDSIKLSLDFLGDRLLREFDQHPINFLDIHFEGLSKEFVEDCIRYTSYTISSGFKSELNRRFLLLNQFSMKEIFENCDNVFVWGFDKISASSLSQISLNIFSELLVDKLRASEVPTSYWRILSVYDASSLSITNVLKDIRNEIVNGKVVIDLLSFSELCPHFFNHGLLDPKLDIFRTIFRMDFVDSESFIEILIKYYEPFEKLFQLAAPDDKVTFVNTVREKESLEFVRTFAKRLGI